MNNKGQAVGVGAFILLFIGVIVAIPLFQSSAQNVNDVVNLGFTRNATVALNAAPNTTVTLLGQAVSNFVALNATVTSNKTIAPGNYTISNYVLSNGQLVSQVKFISQEYNGSSVKLSYDYEPYGYGDAGSRSMISLVLIMSALAIVAFVIAANWETIRELFD